ncbi:uncharacterized protein LOC111697627 [Eurytemora carolleeae]|uniref:uncharacterized protein LOC111697627 n=1 Tax=Eurytemora carolleeae TaxID=1294199 RepID=UPI000C77667D|nr:uncharacterized protein LOC111697627 [Eurytemora carolleeae]|eukprot:XP_023323460.1 uncharacterized protein LOC111697627 [Eurytemora affinis]
MNEGVGVHEVQERQYGGYGHGSGYGIGPLEECCEKKVDPIILLGVIAALAGLTFFLRQQVLTSIPIGRKLEESFSLSYLLQTISASQKYEEKDVSESFVDPKVEVASEALRILKNFEIKSCKLNFSLCLSDALILSIKDVPWNDKYILHELVQGSAEYLTQGSIHSTWTNIRKIEHIKLTEKCISDYNLCSSKQEDIQFQH